MYLCADTHNFQATVIEYGGYTLPQFIVGTGGAQLHSIPRLGTYVDGDITLHNKFAIGSYGFAYILADKTEGTLIFVSAGEDCPVYSFQIKDQMIYETGLDIKVDCNKISLMIPDYKELMSGDCERVENYDSLLEPDQGDFINEDGRACYKWKPKRK